MKIRELTISNYRGFDRTVKFQLSEKFTVIAGVNGKGKTTILDGLALVLSYLLPQISPSKNKRQPFSDLDINSGAKEAYISIKANCAKIPIEYSVGMNKVDRAVVPAVLLPAVRKSISYAYGDPSRADDEAPLAVYYTTDRAGFRYPKSLPTVMPSRQAMAYNGALSNRLVDYKDFMARYRVAVTEADERLQEGRSFLGKNAVKAINEAISDLLEGFSNLTFEDDPARLIVQKDNVKIDLRQLSDGERSLIAMICDLGRRLTLANPDLKNPLKGAGVVLIDELELHLHPKWQREIVEKLRNTFPNIQFIATTHSPFVIQSIKEGELINLDPEEPAEYSDKSIEDIAENIMGIEIPQKSQRYLDMMEAAEKYFKLLEDINKHPKEEINLAKEKLDELSIPFSDDPAFQALLKVEREAKLKK